MESFVARLLKDYEDGKLSRRQLIQSLALAVVAGPAAAAATVKPAATSTTSAGAPWRTVGLGHISFFVSDYKRSAEWYADLMGWEIRSDNGRQASLRIGDVGSIIIRNVRAPGEYPPGEPPPAVPGRPRITGVIDHIAWNVEPWDTQEGEAELRRRGLSPRPDGETFHVKDPDGWDLQIGGA